MHPEGHHGGGLGLGRRDPVRAQLQQKMLHHVGHHLFSAAGCQVPSELRKIQILE